MTSSREPIIKAQGKCSTENNLIQKLGGVVVKGGVTNVPRLTCVFTAAVSFAVAAQEVLPGKANNGSAISPPRMPVNPQSHSEGLGLGKMEALRRIPNTSRNVVLPGHSPLASFPTAEITIWVWAWG